jgi:hypothetical protein
VGQDAERDQLVVEVAEPGHGEPEAGDLRAAPGHGRRAQSHQPDVESGSVAREAGEAVQRLVQGVGGHRLGLHGLSHQALAHPVEHVQVAVAKVRDGVALVSLRARDERRVQVVGSDRGLCHREGSRQ